MTTKPLIMLATAWLLGVLGSEALPRGPWQVGCALTAMTLAAAIAAWALVGKATRPQFVGNAALGMLLLAALAAGLSIGPRAPPSYPPVPSGIARLEAVVENTRPSREHNTRSVLRILHGARLEDGAPFAPGTYLGAAPTALPSAARVRVLAKVAPRAPFRNPTPHPRPPPQFDIQGEAFIPDASAVQVLEAPRFNAWLDAVRERVRERLIATLPTRSAGIARALVLGDDDAVDAADEADIRDAGLLHVLAVSGLHVALLAGLFVALLSRALLLCRPLAVRFEARRIACALGAPLALLYAAFAGGAPSAWRAAVTTALSWTLIALGHRPDLSAVTALSALVLGAHDPRQIARPAFLLSIVATAAILGGSRPVAHDFRGMVRALFALSARTTLATTPIVLWCFGSVPVVGLLANVILLPIASLLLVQLSAAHVLLATITPWSTPSAVAFTLASDAFLNACGLFARVAPHHDWPPPDIAQGMVLALTATALLCTRSLRAQLVMVALAVACIGLFEWRLRRAEQPVGRVRVTFLDVGQGDAALIDLPDGSAMLIDAGGSPGGGPDPGRAVLLPLLEARRRSRIALAVLTHPHPDHYGGFAALLPQVAIDELWDSGQAETEAELQAPSTEAAHLLADARARGTIVRGPRELCGRLWIRGGARIQVLAPCPRYDSGYDANDNSLVLRIDFGHRRLLFAGDAEQHEEALLLERREALRADVLKVPHHGSRTSSGAAFLAAVAPKLAIISAGLGNRFGHPHAETLERLKTVPHVLSLADVGGTIVETDGNTLRARTWTGQEWSL